MTSGYSQRAPSNVQPSAASMNAAANAALEQLTKNDPYGQSNQSNATGGYQTSYNPNMSSNKVSSYQPAGQGYQNNTSYNNSQVIFIDLVVNYSQKLITKQMPIRLFLKGILKKKYWLTI